MTKSEIPTKLKPRLILLEVALNEILKEKFQVSYRRTEIESHFYRRVEDLQLEVLKQIRILETREQNLTLDFK